MTPAGPPFPRPSRPLSTAWIALSLGAVGLAALLIRFWGTAPEYADRFLILCAAAGVAWNLRASAPHSRPTLRLALPMAFLWAGLFPAAAYLQTQAAGGRSVLLWTVAVVLGLGAVALLLAEGGPRRVRHFAFPILFAAFALPLPSRVMAPLQYRLQDATTTLAAAALPQLGVGVERSGFTLRLEGGDLGVDEACSGVQSLTALAALAAFVAYRKGFGPLRGAILTLLALPLVVGVNALRVILSGAIQECAGREYMRGAWHGALGFALLLVGLAAIVALARIVRRLGSGGASDRPVGARKPTDSDAPPSRAAVGVNALFLAGALAGASAYLLGSSRAETAAQDAPLDDIPMRFEGWVGVDRPVPEAVSSALGQDRILHRAYENNLGQRVYVWVIRWSSAKLVKGYHHPDLCWGNRGFRVTARRTENLLPTGGGVIPATAREFLRGDRETQFVLYWTQEGNRIWTGADEAAARSESGFLARPDWLADAFSARQSQPAGRLLVLIGTGSATPLAQSETIRFARAWAAELYRVCPWAKPEE